MHAPNVLQFLKKGQVWLSRESGVRIRVMKVVGRDVVVASLGKTRRRYVIDCGKFRDWFHGYRFVENPDGTPATETPPDPPRCWTCGKWDHVDDNCKKKVPVQAKVVPKRRYARDED